jgi:hypothetical protein
MTKEFKKDQPHEGYSFNDYYSARWVSHIIYAITAVITKGVAFAITVIVSLIVLVGGFWLAYTYLPTKFFNIIALVVFADILLGVAVRFVHTRRNPPNETQ